MWRLGPGLPVMPVFYLTGSTGHNSMMYTGFRGPRSANSVNYWARGGLNLAPVPEFCGGYYGTAFNAQAYNFDVAYANSDQRRSWDAMPSVDDFFGAEAWPQVMEAYNALPDFPIRFFSRNTVPDALMKMAAVSVGVKLLCHQHMWNRSALTFWDTRSGSTRAMFKWLFDVLKGGVRYPASYCKFGNVDREFLHDDERIRALGPNSALGGWSNTYPTRLVTGLYMQNRNSSNTVAQSAFYCGPQRARNAPADVPAVRLDVTLFDPEMFVAFLGAERDILAAVPDRWYPM
jgi:hypothetical protein